MTIAQLSSAEDDLGTPPKHPTLAGLPKHELMSHRATSWRDSIPQGRGPEIPIDSPLQGSPSWRDKAHQVGTTPTNVVQYDSSQDRSRFHRPCFDEDQHVA